MQPFYFPFSFSLAFCFTKIVRETLCKFLYVYASLKCIFMQYIMINRKLFLGISDFQHLCYKRTIFLLFGFSLFLSFWLNRREWKQKRKNRIFAIFARKRPFLSQIKYWFSVVYSYIGQTTPYPPLLALAGWVSSRPKFFIFYFLFFL